MDKNCSMSPIVASLHLNESLVSHTDETGNWQKMVSFWRKPVHMRKI